MAHPNLDLDSRMGRIRKFLALPDPSNIKQKSKKNLFLRFSNIFMTFFILED